MKCVVEGEIKLLDGQRRTASGSYSRHKYIFKENNEVLPIYRWDFKRVMLHYLGEYAYMVYKIENKIYEFRDLQKILAEYNKWKEGQR